MSILTRGADVAYTIRFLRLLTTDFKDTEAYKNGFIDQDGKKTGKKAITTKEKSSYNTFHRLVFNIKRLLPNNKFATFVSALFLLRETYSLSDKSINKIIRESGVDPLDLIQEGSEWFVDTDLKLSQGVYRVKNAKMVNVTCEELVKPRDQIRVLENAYPIGDVNGVHVYEAVHMNTQQKIYVTIGELLK